jgi:sulfide:quinone oxidoreductase
METKFLTPVLSVSAQISVADLADLAQAGFKSIICNRPDGESADQTGFNEIAKAAEALGLQARYLPAETGKVTNEQGAAFGKLMDELPKPVLAYCRSGTRSTTLWALANASNLSPRFAGETP